MKKVFKQVEVISERNCYIASDAMLRRMSPVPFRRRELKTYDQPGYIEDDLLLLKAG
jgi:hypothetical protein